MCFVAGQSFRRNFANHLEPQGALCISGQFPERITRSGVLSQNGLDAGVVGAI